MEGPLGALVNVRAGVFDGADVGVATGNEVDVMVAVEMLGVTDTLVTPRMTGVAVKMDGVGVEGRNGVGALGKGRITQPLQDDSKNANRIVGIIFFIFPLDLLYLSYAIGQSPRLV